MNRLARSTYERSVRRLMCLTRSSDRMRSSSLGGGAGVGSIRDHLYSSNFRVKTQTKFFKKSPTPATVLGGTALPPTGSPNSRLGSTPMQDKPQFESHATNLGKIVGNLLSLEMGARLAIVKLDERAAKQVQAQLPQVKAGDLVEINAFTNDDDLKQTLEKFNKRAPLNCRLDIKAIVNLRDAMAHGRMFGVGSMKQLRLLKFSRKAKDGKVSVELVQDMTDAWFLQNIQLLNSALEKVRITLDYEKREFS